MSENGHEIRAVQPGSIAEEMEVEPGDFLDTVNGRRPRDIFDYQLLIENPEIKVLIRKHDSGEEWLLEIEKDEDEDLGILFENGLMDDYRTCSNHCLFCFIDQMPAGMRDTLYFKDDDSRLSFLQGNYITLTNMKDADLERMIRYHMEPVNISVQATDPELRKFMLHNRFAGDLMRKLRKLSDAGIRMNGQVVLCKGLNDGNALNQTIRDLEDFYPQMQSLAVVPVGLTRFRKDLYPLKPFKKEDAREVLHTIHTWQNHFYEKYGHYFVHASDEWYLLAELPLPDESRYEGYLQLENGVGMLRLLETEVTRELEKRRRSGICREEADLCRRVSIATGVLAAPTIEKLAGDIHRLYPGTETEVHVIRNDFFGRLITVSGLITGQDLIGQLRGRKLGDALLIPCNMLRSGENVFLDDITLEQAEKELGVPIRVTDREGASLVQNVLEERTPGLHRRQMYEQTDCSDCRKTKRRKIDSV